MDAFPVEEIEKEFLKQIKRNRSTPEMLETLYRILLNQTRFRRNVPLVDIVQIFKKVYSSDYLEKYNYELNLNGLLDFEIDRIRIMVETAIKEKIFVVYYAHGKINKEHAEAMSYAFHDMLSDWCDKEADNLSLRNYLQRYIECDEKTYELKLRAKMEYLLKIAREEFASRLIDDI